MIEERRAETQKPKAITFGFDLSVKTLNYIINYLQLISSQNQFD